ncbi:MAG: ABC transporter permease subunit [Ignisphaera sp.]
MYKWRKLKDRIFFAVILILSIIAITPVIHLIVVTLANGLSVIIRAGPSFFTSIPPAPTSKDVGGIAPSLVGSLMLTALALPITIVIALFSSIMVNEFPRNPLSIAVDVVAKSLASIPTIAVSMVVYLLVVVPMGTFSTLAGVVALTIVSLPYAYTYFSTYLRSIPETYREAAYSIAMSRWKTVTRVFLPIIRRGVLVTVLMTMARILGETAALLFTVGRYRIGVSTSILGPTDALPLLIFDYILTPYRNFQEIAWGAAALLLIAYLIIFIATKLAVRGVKL